MIRLMYLDLKRKFVKSIFSTGAIAAICSLLIFTFLLATKFHFSPSKHQLTDLFFDTFDFVPTAMLGTLFCKKNFFNGAIREGLKVTGSEIDELLKGYEIEKRAYVIKFGKIQVKRKYQKLVINEIERLVNQKQYRELITKYYK